MTGAMKSRPILWLCAAALATLSACAAFKSGSPTQEKPAADAPKLIGRIASIPADKRFVLIQSYGSAKIETGTILTSRGADNRTANLLATGEALGQFAAADLQSGLVQIGDAVYSHHPTTPPSPASNPEPTEIQKKVLPEPPPENN